MVGLRDYHPAPHGRVRSSSRAPSLKSLSVLFLSQPTICLLPTELLVLIFSSIPTRVLLPLTGVCGRFHDVILRVVRHRVILTVPAHHQQLMLDCYHPIDQQSTRPLFCNYLGVKRIDTPEADKIASAKGPQYLGGIAQFSSLYSRFRPARPTMTDNEESVSDESDMSQDGSLPQGPFSALQSEPVRRTVTLDSDESFAQLCCATHLFRHGQRTSTLRSCINTHQGVLRLWRDWLEQQTLVQTAANNIHSSFLEQKASQNLAANKGLMGESDRVLWIGPSKAVGIRFRVKKIQVPDDPVWVRMDGEGAVSYSLELEEVLVRTTHLLLSMEEAVRMEAHDAVYFTLTRDALNHLGYSNYASAVGAF